MLRVSAAAKPATRAHVMRSYKAMSHGTFRLLLGCAGMATLMLSTPALADVKAGVDAWSRGDYAAAVKEWEGPAATGDADALFNLAQAYRLGRGVASDLARAEALYARAAAAGHIQASDTYGLMLFQDGRRQAALPYVQGAAKRGDPRSQYLLGIAHFNGDLLPRDYVRAYALMTLANSSGLPQAAQALVQMDQHIPLAQRQQGVALSAQLRQEADALRATQLAAVDLGSQASAPPPSPTRPVGSPVMRPPQPLPTTSTSPSVAAARAAVEAARTATGSESPAQAGVSRQPAASVPQVTAPPVRPASAPAAGAGPWRVQLGAFSVPDNAVKLWQRLGARAELAGRARLLVPAGRVTKLQAGGFSTRAAAESACRSLAASGNACIVTDR